MAGRRAASDASRGACRSSTMIVMMMAITPSLKASSRPLLIFGFEPPHSRASYQAASDWNTGGCAGVARIRELEASRYLYLPETSGRERMARRACSVLAAVQLRGDNRGRQLFRAEEHAGDSRATLRGKLRIDLFFESRRQANERARVVALEAGGGTG